MAVRGTIRYESIAVSTTVVALTQTAVGGMKPKCAHITVETNSIRYRVDGVDPEATEGHLVIAGGVIELTSPDEVTKFRAIRATADGVIKVTQGTEYIPS